MPVDPIRVMIVAQLRIAGSSVSKIASETGYSQGAVSKIIGGTRRSNIVENAVAKALNTTAEQLWPHRFPDRAQKPVETDVPECREVTHE